MRAASAALVLGLSLAASPAGAAKPARACIDAHAEGQVERDSGRLLRASERFRACAADSCPTLIRKECQELGAAVLEQVPSVVVTAREEDGRPIAGARALIDSERSVPTLDGTAIPLDPGVHQVEVLLPDGRRQTLNLSLSYGEKARPAVASFAAPVVVRPAASSSNHLAYVIGGAGLLALGAWGAFAWDGSRREGNLETCAPRCTDRSEVDAMRRSYLVADVLLGVSAAALGTSAYLLIVNGNDDGQSQRGLVVGARGTF